MEHVAVRADAYGLHLPVPREGRRVGGAAGAEDLESWRVRGEVGREKRRRAEREEENK